MRKRTSTKTVKKQKSPSKLYFIVTFTLGVLLFFFTLTALQLPNLTKNVLATKTCANSISCIGDLSGVYQKNSLGIYMGKRVMPPSEQPYLAMKNVLGETTNTAKHIYVDLTNQYLYAIQNNQFMFGFPISSGLTNYTPTGDFKIWIKLRYTRMKGGSVENGTYYDLPNVPYTMFFYNDQIPKYLGYSLHGAYWHNNFGHPMSHGCVNISPDNAKVLFDWADPVTTGDVTYPTEQDPGTIVTIFGTTPRT